LPHIEGNEITSSNRQPLPCIINNTFIIIIIIVIIITQGRLSLSTVGNRCAKDSFRGNFIKSLTNFNIQKSKIDVGWGFPTGEAYSAPPDPW